MARPSPTASAPGADAVARDLLAALADAPDAAAAAAAVAALAAERFLGRVGGERHLARLLTNPAYAPLVGHRDARREPAERLGDAARVAFDVRGPGGARAAYLVSLVRRDGGAWRVTGLVRQELRAL